jgi:hypothetical protein
VIVTPDSDPGPGRESGSGLLVRPIFSNPIKDRATLSFSTGQSEQVLVGLHDALDRTGKSPDR